MKHVIMASALIPACFVLACGTKKDEKKVPVEVVTVSSDSTVSPDQNSQKKCDSDDASQNQNCLPTIPVGEMLVLNEGSWLNPRFGINDDFLGADGSCLEKFTAARQNENSIAPLDVTLQNMKLKDDAARCLVQIRVAYKKGYAFAVRKVEVPLMTEIPLDSQAAFQGSYGIKGKKLVEMERTLEARYSNKPLRMDYTVADQDIVWSSCSCQATRVIDTKVSMALNGSASGGDIRIEGKTPYRMEIVWAKCQ